MSSTSKNDLALALDAVRELFEPTPLQLNAHLSARYGADIWLKREDLTPVRSYKIRGAMNFFRAYLAKGGTSGEFVCASAGNHAQGFAFVCNSLQKHGVVFMPVTTPQQKIDKTRTFGGDYIDIRLIGDIFDDCYAAAMAHAEKVDAVMVPPFNHADIVTGQATCGLELLDQMPDGHSPDLVIMPVGGGGLAAGLIEAFRDRGLDIPIRLVEPKGAPSLAKALEAGHPVKLKSVDNFVDGAAVAEVGAVPFDVIQSYPNRTESLIDENRLCSTITSMLNTEGIVLEPAGALAIDALKDFSPAAIEGKTIVCLVTGGNFDFERLPEVKERALRADGLKKYFIIRFPQRPGALRDFLALLGPDDDITRFEYLKKSARNFGSVLLGLETKNRSSFDALQARFEEAGIHYQDITENDVLSNLII